jgi:hypothetical protein
MREIVAKCVVLLAVGLSGLAVEGCEEADAPVAQPIVRSLPLKMVQPDFTVAPLPVEKMDSTAKVNQAAVLPQVQPVQVQRTQVQPVQEQRTDEEAAWIAAQQREQDAKLLQQQEAESQRQQEELDQEIEHNLQVQQQIESEPWVQDAPGPIPTEPIPSWAPPAQSMPAPE